MDHTRLPRDTVLPLRRVPKVCTDDLIFDGTTEFMEWPFLTGFLHPDLIDESKEIIYDHFKKQRYSTSLVESCFQGWIFFGLLHQLLSPCDLYDANDFINIDESGVATLHTRCLMEKMTAWRLAFLEIGDEKLNALARHMYTCLYVADWAFSAIYAGSDYSDFNKTISMSLEILCETIAETFHPKYMTDMPSFGGPARMEGQVKATMLQNGWCPSEIQRVNKQFTTSACARLFYQHMSMPDFGTDHSNCSLEECTTLQTDVKTYRTRHAVDGCDCALLGPDLNQVVSCLEDDDFPVLEVATVEGVLNLNVVRSKALQGNEGYVALSHVWADGLGNASRMELPECQIRRIYGLVQDIAYRDGIPSLSSQTPIRKLYLWCDTLVCPVETPAKIMAISKLQEVYERAACVLALDRSLEQYSYREIGPAEAGMRLQVSRWCQRLWTFQEGQLADRLYIQFADLAVDFETIYQSLMTADPTHDPEAFVLAQSLRISVHLRPPGGQHVKLPFNIVDSGFSHRGVSVPTDEPICLATTLGMDAGVVTRAPPERRWEAFWTLASAFDPGIEEGVIFHRHPRVRARGFRWAPRTIRKSLKHDFKSTLAVRGRATAKLTPEGLEVGFPGWRIRRRQALPVWRAYVVMQIRTIPDEGLPLRHPSGRWFEIVSPNHTDAELPDFPVDPIRSDEGGEKEGEQEGEGGEGVDWHVILVQDDWSDPDTRRVDGLLTKLEVGEDGGECFRTMAVKNVLPLPEPWTEDLDLAMKYGDELRGSWDFEAGQIFVGWLNALPDEEREEGEEMHPDMESRFGKCLLVCLERALTRCIERLYRIGREVPSFEGAIAYIRGRENPSNFDMTIAKLLLSGYGTVEEVFDESKRWYVD